MASSSFNIISGWTVEQISTTTAGAMSLYANKSLKLAIVMYNSQEATSGGTFTMPNWVIPAANAYGVLRNDGYLNVTAGNTQGTIVNSTAYSVGQIVFPIR